MRRQATKPGKVSNTRRHTVAIVVIKKVLPFRYNFLFFRCCCCFCFCFYCQQAYLSQLLVKLCMCCEYKNKLNIHHIQQKISFYPTKDNTITIKNPIAHASCHYYRSYSLFEFLRTQERGSTYEYTCTYRESQKKVYIKKKNS